MKINNDNIRYGKNLSKDWAASDALFKKKLEIEAKRDRPSREDNLHEREQRNLAVLLAKSFEPYAEEDLRKKGFYVLQQYRIEKRRQLAGEAYYNNGKNLDDFDEETLKEFRPAFFDGYYRAQELDKENNNHKTR